MTESTNELPGPNNRQRIGVPPRKTYPALIVRISGAASMPLDPTIRRRSH